MTRADLARRLFATGEFTKEESQKLVDLLFETLKESLGQGQSVSLASFGRFVLQDRKAFSVVRNGVEAKVADRRVCLFRPSKCLVTILCARLRQVRVAG